LNGSWGEEFNQNFSHKAKWMHRIMKQESYAIKIKPISYMNNPPGIIKIRWWSILEEIYASRCQTSEILAARGKMFLSYAS